jgi:hypothetical protein
MAFCEKLDPKNEKDKEILDKIDNKDPEWPMVAEIGKEGGTNKIKFYKICEDVKEIKCDGTPIGYIKIRVIDNKKKEQTHKFTFKLESIKPELMKEDPDCVIAFVDGSSGGTNEETGETNDVVVNEVSYQAYGGAYMLYRPGETEAFCKSWENEKEPKEKEPKSPKIIKLEDINFGLMGISNGPGNVYGEINSAIGAIQKADELAEKEKFKKLRLYYDCEQIGGHVPGIGVFNKHDTPISRKYVTFWRKALVEKDEYKGKYDDPSFKELKHLEEIELIHVDAHTKPEFTANDDVDKMAKNVRDTAMNMFKFLWDNREKYKKTDDDSEDSKTE